MAISSVNRHIIDVDERLASSIERKLCHKPPSSSRSCIFKIPIVLRQLSVNAFIPNLVTIGPFHHGKESFKFMEEMKLWYLRVLISRAPTPQTSLKNFTKSIRELEESARECYAEQLVGISEDEFIEMMIVDGCFIIELFRKKAKAREVQRDSDDLQRDSDDPIFKSSWMDTYLQIDLMLLENQLPWFVLECLFNLTVIPEERSLSLIDLALGFFDSMLPMKESAKSNSNFETKHLLDLLRNILLSSSGYVLEQTSKDEYWEVIPPVTDLNEAGIKFKMGTPDNILNVKFSNGVLEIPPLVIQGSTERLFRNLIAYEQCYEVFPYRITSYVMFLDCLINSSRDTHLLCDNGILENWLGTEEDASVLFNRVLKGATLHKFYYVGLCQQVNAYYRTRWPKWRATLKRNYFSNPWAIISLIGAIVLLVLTFLQTLFSIRSY